MKDLAVLNSTEISRIDADQLLPLNINFDYYLQRRSRVLTNNPDMPKYLLFPEVERLLNETLNDRHRLLFDFLWQTGARITEALKVRPCDLELDTPLNSNVSIATLKRRYPSRKKVSSPVRRVVPLINEGIILDLKRYIETHHIKRMSPLFDLTRQAVALAIKRWVDELDPPLSIDVSAHTFRHSFAVNHVLYGMGIHSIMKWLGHTSLNSTLVYINVLGSDTNHLAIRTRFR